MPLVQRDAQSGDRRAFRWFVQPICGTRNLSPVCLLILLLAASAHAQQSLIAELKLQHDPGKRSELALTVADELFEGARAHYGKGEISKGDAELEDMTSALN